MQNARATARAELSRLPPALSRSMAVTPVHSGAVSEELQQARSLLLAGDSAAISGAVARLRGATPGAAVGAGAGAGAGIGAGDGFKAILALALQQALAGDAERAAIAAWLDVEIAGAAGCHVRPR